MALAQVTSFRSKDPNTKVGAVIVNDKKRIVALGYNGMPQGNDKDFPWIREAEKKKDTKYPYVIHAELNAILNATISVVGTTLYVTLFPCSDCTKLVAQAGIKEIVYAEDKYKDTEDGRIAHHIAQVLGIKIRKFELLDLVIK